MRLRLSFKTALERQTGEACLLEQTILMLFAPFNLIFFDIKGGATRAYILLYILLQL